MLPHTHQPREETLPARSAPCGQPAAAAKHTCKRQNLHFSFRESLPWSTQTQVEAAGALHFMVLTFHLHESSLVLSAAPQITPEQPRRGWCNRFSCLHGLIIADPSSQSMSCVRTGVTQKSSSREGQVSWAGCKGHFSLQEEL